MAMRLGARGKYTYLCDWLLHQNILEDEQIFNKCCEIFGIICAVPEKSRMAEMRIILDSLSNCMISGMTMTVKSCRKEYY